MIIVKAIVSSGDFFVVYVSHSCYFRVSREWRREEVLSFIELARVPPGTSRKLDF